MPVEAVSLKGKSAIVAGGGRGIGAAVSKLLGEAGASVAVVDIERERAQGTAKEIVAAGGRAVPVIADLLNAQGAQQIVEETRAAFGGVDVLANVAGGAFAYVKFRKMAEWTEEEWDLIQNRNLRYIFLLCRAVIKQMIQQGRGGSIVSITSISGVVSAPNHAAYGAAKGGLILLTKSLAAEYGQYGIRFNAVSPGSIETPATGGPRPPNERDRYKTLVPLGRIGQPLDIAKAVLFFASDLSAYITGQMLLVDGGASVNYPLTTGSSPTVV